MARVKHAASSRGIEAERMMAEPNHSPRRSETPTASVVPAKRPFEEDAHAPAIPSPLNPDAASKQRKGTVREQREKKESFKKRESKGGDSRRDSTPEASKGKKSAKPVSTSTAPELARWNHPPPVESDFEPPRQPVLIPRAPPLVIGDREFFETSEHVFNKKGWRYARYVADPRFPNIQYYRPTDNAPYTARLDYEDHSVLALYDQGCRSMTVEKGWRMARGNVCVREGRWYWECKILQGIKKAVGDEPIGRNKSYDPHVRIGFSRREASLETPVGFDAYSYGLRDVEGQKVHMSRPTSLMPPGQHFEEGDVVGIEINLPSLALHRKIVEGTYNKAVDSPEDDPGVEHHDVIRDRVPLRLKDRMNYWEFFEYNTQKELEDLMNPAQHTVSAAKRPSPYPNHESPALRTLPGSFIKVFKNGSYVGTPFRDLLAFLPLASRPDTSVGKYVRPGCDDGTLGYYPSVSCFNGGAAEVNFGPKLWCPPPSQATAHDGNLGEDVVMGGTDGESEAKAKSALAAWRPLGERYAEQVAEDVVYDIIDEVDCWSRDNLE